jgi:hypothetical protein
VVEIEVAVRRLVGASITYSPTGCSVAVGPEIDDRHEWNEYPAPSSRPSLCRHQGGVSASRNYVDHGLHDHAPENRLLATTEAPSCPPTATRRPAADQPIADKKGRRFRPFPVEPLRSNRPTIVLPFTSGLQRMFRRFAFDVQSNRRPCALDHAPTGSRISPLFTPGMSRCTAHYV